MQKQNHSPEATAAKLAPAPHVISGRQFEERLNAVLKQAKGPVEGMFGPESITWHITRNRILYAGGAYVVLMQLAHPQIAEAIRDHSMYRQNPLERLRPDHALAVHPSTMVTWTAPARPLW